jgi:NOL1/NOP2/fmu family ribosome biogenesis protein
MFEHRKMSGAIVEIRDKRKPTPIEAELKSVIAKFTQLQKDRYEADYDVGKSWSRTEVTRTLELADEIFATWRRVRKDRLAQDHLLSMFGARN